MAVCYMESLFTLYPRRHVLLRNYCNNVGMYIIITTHVYVHGISGPSL